MKVKFVLFSFLFLLANCNKKENLTLGKTTKVDTFVKDNTIKNDQAHINVKPQEKFFENLETKNFPLIDSTNFDNFNYENELSQYLVKKLDLRKLNQNAEKFYVNYKVDLSNNFNSIVVTTKSEMEMKTFLVNLNNNKIIDFIEISYDEIAESALISIGKISKQNITVEHYNYMSESPEKTTNIYKISKLGRFEKK